MQPLGQFAITIFSFLRRTDDFHIAFVEFVKDAAFGLHLTWVAECTGDTTVMWYWVRGLIYIHGA